jgi:cytoskeletal protein CcmA (bactofilin family)
VRWNMFDRKHADAAAWSGFLEQGTKLEGKLESRGTLRVDSNFTGAIVSEATLILGENARGNGEMAGNSVLIGGFFEGVVRARTKVELQPKAIVSGEIETPCLVIEPGATFDGRCHVLGQKDGGKPVTIAIRSAATRT